MNGKVITDLSPGISNIALGVAIQADGNIVVVGTAGTIPRRVAMACYRGNDGALDTTFDRDGVLFTDVVNLAYGQTNGTSVPFDVNIQSDQKIVVAGYSDNGGDFEIARVRYNPNGSRDTTFSADGIVTTKIGMTTEAKAVAIQSDGKILVAGYYASSFPDSYHFALVRYTNDGIPDATFGINGVVTITIGATDLLALGLAMQSDGKIVVAGTATTSGTDKDFAVIGVWS